MADNPWFLWIRSKRIWESKEGSRRKGSSGRKNSQDYNGLIASMNAIGEKFKNNEIFIPEVLIAAKAMHSGIAVLEPQFTACGIKPAGKVVIGTVKGHARMSQSLANNLWLSSLQQCETGKGVP